MQLYDLDDLLDLHGRISAEAASVLFDIPVGTIKKAWTRGFARGWLRRRG